MAKRRLNEDGSAMNEAPRIRRKKKDIIDGESNGIAAAERKIEGYCTQIRKETECLAKLTKEISAAYSMYAESEERADSEMSLHNGLANMLKLIEVQNAMKLRIKTMQVSILQIINNTTCDSELPFALADILREVNVSFLDSKLVRAYGEIAKVMKEDLDLAKADSKRINFTAGNLSSELEAMESIEILPDLGFEDEDNENSEEH